MGRKTFVFPKNHRNEERYKMSSGNACIMGKNQLIPFVLILAVALGALIFCIRSALSSALQEIEEAKAAASTKTLATILIDPFSMGEYDHMQTILDATKSADGDVDYAIVLTPDGKAVATTDRSLKDVTVARDDFEKTALTATDFKLRPTKNGYETVIPIKSVVGPAGFLRIGMTRASIDNSARKLFNLALMVALGALVVGAGLFCMLLKGNAGETTSGTASGTSS
jgi:uncharacterized membrane protein affecting hemolysin expression